MSDQVVYSPKPWLFHRQIWQPMILVLIGLPLAGFGMYFAPSLSGMVLIGAAVTVFLVAIITSLSDWLTARRSASVLGGAGELIMNDPSPCFCTDGQGVIVALNDAAAVRLGAKLGEPSVKALSRTMVNAAAVIFRQEGACSDVGFSRETVSTRHGHLRVTTHRAGLGMVWRIDDALATAPRNGDGIGLPMLVVSQNGTILSMNDAMRSLLGQRARSLAGIFGDGPVVSGTRMLLRGADGPVAATVVEVEAGDGRREIYAIPKDGMDCASPVPAAFFEALPVAALLVQANGEVQSHNAAARKLLNIESSETKVVVGDLVEGPGRLAREWMKDIIEERAPNRSEIVRMLRGPDERSVRITVTPLPGQSEPRLLAVLQDATEVQDLHTQFAQSQKMQAIGELAGGVAHDFNNLLTAITGHCDLLLLRHDQGDQDYADLVQIHQNANRAASLVGQLLAFSRKQTMRPELLDLRDTMADLTHLLNRLVGERVMLELRQDPALQPIWADRRLLDQVLMNLVVNARDAMPEGGPIRITSRMARLGAGLQRNNANVPPGTYVLIEVEDSGIGIPADRIGRIFEPFFTTKKVGEGTGLGLSMAYGIMKQSGGYIFCDSRDGEGTTFSLFFPAHDWPAESASLTVSDPSAEAASEMPRDDSGVIMLVEDEAPVRAFASRALRLKGYSVLEAENGDEALELLEDDELEIDVFVTDMIMPGKGGPDWVREALKSRPEVGVVFTSGYAEDAYGKFPDIPQAVFLAKPFSLADLTDTVRREMR
ncbi:MAG: ATP-binding protein [Pseudomonadota bacterium]